ncbi:unnamed protein product [Cuscuta campestris]|uniref:Uncharacterized protein n=1 Tax=Cuscuta campestris TaxID=132261 RepID=A0A484N0Z6_9ASTE|nr:unnamed protein product [Cuscuta campestris]
MRSYYLKGEAEKLNEKLLLLQSHKKTWWYWVSIDMPQWSLKREILIESSRDSKKGKKRKRIVLQTTKKNKEK